MANNILHLPSTTMAESELIEASNILDRLQHIPYADLSKLMVRVATTGEPLNGVEALMSLSSGFLKLAQAVQDYQLAQVVNIESGRVKP